MGDQALQGRERGQDGHIREEGQHRDKHRPISQAFQQFKGDEDAPHQNASLNQLLSSSLPWQERRLSCHIFWRPPLCLPMPTHGSRQLPEARNPVLPSQAREGAPSCHWWKQQKWLTLWLWHLVISRMVNHHSHLSIHSGALRSGAPSSDGRPSRRKRNGNTPNNLLLALAFSLRGRGKGGGAQAFALKVCN